MNESIELLDILHNKKGILTTLLGKQFLFFLYEGAPVLVKVDQNYKCIKKLFNVVYNYQKDSQKKINLIDISLEKECHLKIPNIVWFDGSPILLDKIEDGVELNFDAFSINKQGYIAILIWLGNKPISLPILGYEEYMLVEEYSDIPVYGFDEGGINGTIYIKIDNCIKKVAIANISEDKRKLYDKQKYEKIFAIVYKLICSYSCDFLYLCCDIYVKHSEYIKNSDSVNKIGCILKLNSHLHLVPFESQFKIFYDTKFEYHNDTSLLYFNLNGNDICINQDYKDIFINYEQHLSLQIIGKNVKFLGIAHIFYNKMVENICWKVVILNSEIIFGKHNEIDVGNQHFSCKIDNELVLENFRKDKQSLSINCEKILNTYLNNLTISYVSEGIPNSLITFNEYMICNKSSKFLEQAASSSSIESYGSDIFKKCDNYGTISLKYNSTKFTTTNTVSPLHLILKLNGSNDNFTEVNPQLFRNHRAIIIEKCQKNVTLEFLLLNGEKYLMDLRNEMLIYIGNNTWDTIGNQKLKLKVYFDVIIFKGYIKICFLWINEKPDKYFGILEDSDTDKYYIMYFDCPGIVIDVNSKYFNIFVCTDSKDFNLDINKETIVFDESGIPYGELKLGDLILINLVTFNSGSPITALILLGTNSIKINKYFNYCKLQPIFNFYNSCSLAMEGDNFYILAAHKEYFILHKEDVYLNQLVLKSNLNCYAIKLREPIKLNDLQITRWALVSWQGKKTSYIEDKFCLKYLHLYKKENYSDAIKDLNLKIKNDCFQSKSILKGNNNAAVVDSNAIKNDEVNLKQKENKLTGFNNSLNKNIQINKEEKRDVKDIYQVYDCLELECSNANSNDDKSQSKIKNNKASNVGNKLPVTRPNLEFECRDTGINAVSIDDNLESKIKNNETRDVGNKLPVTKSLLQQSLSSVENSACNKSNEDNLKSNNAHVYTKKSSNINLNNYFIESIIYYMSNYKVLLLSNRNVNSILILDDFYSQTRNYFPKNNIPVSSYAVKLRQPYYINNIFITVWALVAWQGKKKLVGLDVEQAFRYERQSYLNNKDKFTILEKKIQKEFDSRFNPRNLVPSWMSPSVTCELPAESISWKFVFNTDIIPVYHLSGVVVFFDKSKNQGIMKLSHKSTKMEFYCYFDKRCLFNVRSIVQSLEYPYKTNDFTCGAYKCIVNKIYGFDVSFSAVIVWKPGDLTPNKPIFFKILENFLYEKSIAVVNLEVKKEKISVKQSSLNSELKKKGVKQSFKSSKAKDVGNLTSEANILTKVSVPSISASIAPMTIRKLSDSKDLYSSDTIHLVEETSGTIKKSENEIYHFTREKVFLYGISIYSFPLTDILKKGCPVEYSVDEHNCIKEVHIGGGPEINEASTYNSILKWCNYYSIPLEIKVKLKRLKDIIAISVGGAITFCGIGIYTNNENFYQSFIMRGFHKLDPETAHKFSINLARYNLVPSEKLHDMKTLKMTAFGINFENAIGLAAGYDKNAEAVDGLFKMGFGFVEVGTVTPEPQEGNPKPRVFRLSDIKGIINRYGFNSDGYEAVYERLVRLSIPKERRGILGVNIGKNKDSQNHINDYVLGIKKFGHIADYIVINVSSPNTPGLRNLQHKGELVALTTAVLEAKNNLNIENKPSILLKLSPDLSYEDKKDIAKVILNSKTKVDGLIISNTTLSRPDISSCHINESGGLSGEPLKQLSLKTIKDMALLTKGEIPIIGVGGISSGRDALDCIKNGASLVQIYTVLTYDGPPVIRRIARELDDLLRDEGYSSISEAVGADLQIKKESWWRWW